MLFFGYSNLTNYRVIICTISLCLGVTAAFLFFFFFFLQRGKLKQRKMKLTWKFQNLSGKGPSTGISLLLLCCKAGSPPPKSGALTTSLTPSLVPTTFSRLQQEKTPTLSTSHTNQPSQIHSLCWCFFGPYVEFQLLHYFAYSTNVMSNILPN